MEPNFQTSFIPKKPIMEERSRPARSVGFFAIISIFIFFTVLLSTGGLYFYKEVIAKRITLKENSLNLAKGDFEPSKIKELQLLDKRLRASTEILSRHIAVTPIFEALSAVTMKNVRYTKFTYSFADANNNTTSKIIIKMSGQAVGYRSIALQSDLFTTKDEGKNFIDPVFSNLSPDDRGNILFDLEFSVDPDFVNYKQTLETVN